MGNDPPKAFISYSWDNAEHKAWTKEFATRLRADGVAVVLDQWAVVPGDQLPRFMETAIRENSFVLIICTPNYKRKSDARDGGVGYEGDIMTAEVLTGGNHRKFIPVVRSVPRSASVPSWLDGKYSLDLSGDPYAEDQYEDLVATLLNRREPAPAVGRRPQSRQRSQSATGRDDGSTPIKIEGVIVDEVGSPRNDGTRGSALYVVPFKLNRRPSQVWAELFIRAWDHPPSLTPGHRPGIARVEGDRVVLTRTTIEEVRDTHRETLKLAVEVANSELTEWERQRRQAQDAAEKREREHRDRVRNVGSELSFDA